MLIVVCFFWTVSVGFEYESCPDMILWEKRTAILQGYESTASNLGGWSIDKHHALNIQSGKISHSLLHTHTHTLACCTALCETKNTDLLIALELKVYTERVLIMFCLICISLVCFHSSPALLFTY